MDTALVDRLDALLPQTQCGRCGYDACLPYAQAIAAGAADINRCPPGGEATVAALSALTGREPRPIDPACGMPGPPATAVIDESACIGCTLCIDACPVDAILGAPRQMHVVMSALCSGCELCVAPCPVDCIAIVPSPRPWTPEDAIAARDRHRARQARLSHGERIESRGQRTPPADVAAQRQATVSAAMARARARRAAGAMR